MLLVCTKEFVNLEATEVEDIETPWDRKIQTSCAGCNNLGTTRCLALPGGYNCVCKSGWSVSAHHLEEIKWCAQREKFDSNSFKV